MNSAQTRFWRSNARRRTPAFDSSSHLSQTRYKMLYSWATHASTYSTSPLTRCTIRPLATTRQDAHDAGNLLTPQPLSSRPSLHDATHTHSTAARTHALPHSTPVRAHTRH